MSLIFKIGDYSSDPMPVPHVRFNREKIYSHSDFLVKWIEERTRLIEQQESKPHHALEMIRLVSQIYNAMDNSGNSTLLPVTPSREVENVLLFAYLKGIEGTKDSAEHQPAFALKMQLEDMVYLWVFFVIARLTNRIIMVFSYRYPGILKCRPGILVTSMV